MVKVSSAVKDGNICLVAAMLDSGITADSGQVSPIYKLFPNFTPATPPPPSEYGWPSTQLAHRRTCTLQLVSTNWKYVFTFLHPKRDDVLIFAFMMQHVQALSWMLATNPCVDVQDEL